MAHRQPKAFWSYTRFDDEHARGTLTTLRKRLEDELRAQRGTPYAIYQDVIDLTWGADWQQRLLTGIDEATFFIPIITPNYCESTACRAELETFRQREQQLLYEELILPLYWIEIDRPTDELASTLMSRNYADFRKQRTLPADDPKMDEKIALLATQLLSRLNEVNEHQRQIAKSNATITTPKHHEQVPRKVNVTGTTTSIPAGVTPWLVVEAGGKYHPQTPITNSPWNAAATVGTQGFGSSNHHDFPLHIMLTSKSANTAFNNYQTEQRKTKAWNGLPRSAGTKILATTTVRRDDHSSALKDLIGTYDEYRAKPLVGPSGIIAIKGTPYGNLTLTAINKAGNTEWSGSITINPTNGEATAKYKYTQGSGKGTLELQQQRDEVSVTGKDDAAPGKPFYMTWKKRPTTP